MGASLFASTGPAGQALSPLSPEGKGDLGESGGAPLQVVLIFHCGEKS